MVYTVIERIFQFSNKLLHQYLLIHPVIILITFFCVLKIFPLCDEFSQNNNPQFISE